MSKVKLKTARQKLEQLAKEYNIWVKWTIDQQKDNDLEYGGFIGQDGLPILLDVVKAAFTKKEYIVAFVHSSKEIYDKRPKFISKPLETHILLSKSDLKN